MPTTDPRRALRPRDVRGIVERACLPAVDGGERTGRVGLEVELFPIRVTADGTPAGRVPLRGPDGMLAVLEHARAAHPTRFASPADDALRLAGGGAVTFEPGGQLEIATACHPTLREALAEAEQMAAVLGHAAASQGVALAAAGVDPWHDVAAAEPQLRSPRYQAMASYFAARGDAGALMMRHTCALQVNLDLPPAVAVRWEVANLLGPLLTAMFACSPSSSGPRAVSRRALIWQAVDPSRTGAAPALSGRAPDPVGQMVTAALRADVLLFAAGDDMLPGRPGFTFRAWLADGDARFGWPTAADLRYHLTTLFHDVRPRRWMELRAVDALPQRWRAVPAVLLVGLLEDPEALVAARRLLRRHADALARRRRRAAVAGLADPLLARLARAVWDCALAGARRLPPDYVGAEALLHAEEFLDRFTARGRSPADELAALLRTAPAQAMAWAREPVPAPA